MSQENVELTYRALTPSTDDFDAFLAPMDDDVEVFSRLVPWRAAITAATESVAGASS